MWQVGRGGYSDNLLRRLSAGGYRPATSEVLRHNLLILVGLPSLILLPAGTSIVLPVGYMDQPTGLLHIYL